MACAENKVSSDARKRDVVNKRGATHPPIPLVLVAEGSHEVSDEHHDHEGDHGHEPHLRLADPPVALRQLRGDPIAHRPRREQAHQRSHEDGEIGEADGLRREVVGRGGEDLTLREVEGEEGGGAPGDDEGGELDDGESKELPGNPQVEEYAPEGMLVGLEEAELLLVRHAFSEVWVSRCGGLLGEVDLRSAELGVDLLDGFGLLGCRRLSFLRGLRVG